MSGLGAVFWKEVREQYLRGGRPTVSLVVFAILDVVVGIVAPVLIGQARDLGRAEFLVAAATLAVSALALSSLALPISVVIDAVAGERERHTLETLLASPARDRDIVLGKAFAILAFVAAQAVALGILCMATWSIFAGALGFAAGLAFLVGGSVLSLLASSYTTGLGLFISQRARTVKSGQTILAYCMMPFFLLPSLLGPTLRAQVRGASPLWLAGVGGLVVTVVFLGLNTTFWALALTRFRRDRLLLH